MVIFIDQQYEEVGDENLAKRTGPNNMAKDPGIINLVTSSDLVHSTVSKSPPIYDVTDEKNGDVIREEKEFTVTDNQIACSLFDSIHSEQCMEICEAETSEDHLNSNLLNMDETGTRLPFKKFSVFEDDRIENCRSSPVATMKNDHADERLSKRERRFMKRIQRLEKKRSNRKSNRDRTGNNKQAVRMTSFSDIETMPGSKSRTAQLCPAQEDKENTSFLCDQKRHRYLHNHNLCCSPVANVVKRMFSPIRSRSPFVRRESRSKRKVSYTEPSLSK